MRGWLAGLVSIDVERSDWMRRRGRQVTLKLGPFGFFVDTADGGTFGFTVATGEGAVGWFWDRRP